MSRQSLGYERDGKSGTNGNQRFYENSQWITGGWKFRRCLRSRFLTNHRDTENAEKGGKREICQVFDLDKCLQADSREISGFGLSRAIIPRICFTLGFAGIVWAMPFGLALWAIAGSRNYAWGQVVGDDTLGAERSQVTFPGLGAFQIDGGATRGTNLFHSFSQFSVPTGGSAYFNNALTIQNIIMRVTGESVSNIDGLIRANGTANLLLINPNGIIFGSNAKLNINGSFIASTANSVLFADGTEFSATDTQTPLLLTVNVPIGLQLGNNPNPVKVNRSNLEVKPHQNLVLLGGEVSLDKAKLTAPGGRIELGGLSTVGDVGLSDTGSLIFPNNVARADVSVTNGTSVNVRAGGGGFISINARNLEVSRSSKLIAGIGKGLGTPETQAGDVMINASDTVSFDGSRVENQVEQNGKGNAGKIEIITGSLFLSNQTELNASTQGQGNAGPVILKASDSISLKNDTLIRSRVYENAFGNSGGIDITTGNFSLVNGGGLSATTDGTGHAGQVTIRANGSISLRNGPYISSRVAEHGTGNSGGIFITADSLSLTNNVRLHAYVAEQGVGNSEGISITVNSLSVSNQSELDTSTKGRGNAGSIIIRARDSISLKNDALIRSRVYQNAVGNSGGIDITTGNFSLVNGGGLSATTDGTGHAGQVTIRANGSISLRNGPYISSRVAEHGTGNSGGIFITADSLSLTNDAQLNVSSFGQGNPGNLVIKADSIRLENQGKLTAQTLSGEGGNIVLNVGDILFLRDNSLISAQAAGDAQGGNINIDAGFIIALPNQNNDIIASAQRGNGGNINITTQAILGLEERSSTPSNSTNDIDASSEFGLNGNVSIKTPDVDPSRGLANLPVEPVNLEVAQGCQTAETQGAIEFFNIGKGGLASNPYEPLSSSEIWEDVPLPKQKTENAASVSVSPATPSGKIVEAQGWLVNEKGEVVLIAEVPSNRFHRRCR
jgi:filamentous hemagglutinin family protein